MTLSPQQKGVVGFVVLAAIVGAVAFLTGRGTGENDPAPARNAPPAASTPRDASLGSAARSALERGNAEFRAGRFDVALTHYRAAVAASPGAAAPYFGIYMAAKKLSNGPLADSAQAEVAKRMDTSTVLRSPHPAVPPQ
jgi:hypothetical protein